MLKQVKHGNVTRMSFQQLDDIIEMPNLLEVQKNSYQWFFINYGISINDIKKITCCIYIFWST